MKEKIVMCLILAASFMCAQDFSAINASLEPFTQEQATMIAPNALETKKVDAQLTTAQPIINEEAVQMTEQTPDISQDQFLQELLNVMTPEERAAFEQEAQFLPDRFQPEDLSDLNVMPDISALSDISDEDLIQLIEALSEQSDFNPSENVIQ